jgi:hypothetical protein
LVTGHNRTCKESAGERRAVKARARRLARAVRESVLGLGLGLGLARAVRESGATAHGETLAGGALPLQ